MTESRVSLFGILLVLLGTFMLLDRFALIHLGWSSILWMFGAAFGAAITVEGFLRKRQARVFWGSLMLFVSALLLMRLWRWVDFWGIHWLAVLSLALGLAFLMLFVYNPRQLGVLIPALIFGGFGAAEFLVEWGYMDWWDVRYYVRHYWPVLLILLGVAILLKRRPQASS